ncbi:MULTISPECIES: phosphotransferase [unclassified Streptomyces]|uniref:phosphotransferase n=1 Tax=unclassified Streptomyces TaxID=2593676 RepID=UPI002023FD59|nr:MULTISPECIES: phosphotransferase [unclassified Streptomyces]WSC22301.1 aminoglycoside phosphotransferase family protein [Streptomyces sp. NBC_01766]
MTAPDNEATGGPTEARSILTRANREHRTRFRLDRPLTGGFQSHTWLLAGADETGSDAGRAVLKWSPNPGLVPRTLRAAQAVAEVRAAGYMTPAWVATGVTEAGFPYHIQEFAPGGKADRLTDATARLLVPLLESQRGLDPDPERCWSRYVYESLADGGAELRRRLAATGPDGRRFITAVGALLQAYGEVELPTGDLVHGDFRLANVVVPPDGRPVAVDIEALGSGTRAYDYATLLTEDEVDESAWNLIRAAGERVAGPDVLAYCFALTAMELADFVRERVPGRLPLLIGPLTARAEALRP